MLSDDFNYYGSDREGGLISFDKWYQENIAHNEFYPTFFFSYKSHLYQFDYYGNNRKKWMKVFGDKIKMDSYTFSELDKEGKYIGKISCYDSFKDAVDQARMFDGKTLREIWDSPEAEMIDFE